MKQTTNQKISNQPGLIFYVTNILTYCITNLLSYSFMKNKPNSEAYAETKSKSRRAGEPNFFTHQPIHSSAQSLFMQNKPNLPPNTPTKNAKDTNFTPIFHSLLQLFNHRRRTFTHKSQKIPAFCKFLTLTHLTPYTTKTYITFFIRIKAENKKMQNEPNLQKTMNYEL